MKRPLIFAASLVLLTAVAMPAHAHPGHTHEPVAESAYTPTPVYGEGWEALPAIAGGPRQEHSVAAANGLVYVLGGIVRTPSGGVTTTDRVEVYNPRSRTWATAAPLPIPMNHPNVATVAGKVYVLGGLSGGSSWEALADSFVYDPRTDTWTELPPMPEDIARGSAAIGVHGSTIYLAGGMRTLTPGPGGLQDTVATVSAYDTTGGAWTSLPDLPEARDHVAGAVVGGTLYVLGGRDRGQVNVRDDVYALNLRSGATWTERAPMPTPRGGIASAVVGSKIYTFGGEGNPAPGANSIYSEVEVYDVNSNTWTQLAPMPLPRHGTAATTVGDTIYIPGGGNLAGGSPIDAADSFSPRR